ncbi:hypothetical protein BpHYR1_030956 [Brachionus plicatilis]|uniref:Uncharacterized protein n=1 Tax=Brachionus plicatilis TaxID=10195 RepID=A0A3M7SW49_BRAPC|nr:hypothetical protein BpHYR1_030956 [Brachionus plicatilis]
MPDSSKPFMVMNIKAFKNANSLLMTASRFYKLIGVDYQHQRILIKMCNKTFQIFYASGVAIILNYMAKIYDNLEYIHHLLPNTEEEVIESYQKAPHNIKKFEYF